MDWFRIRMMTNYEYLMKLSAELMAKVFAKLSQGDSAGYEDWLEWMLAPASTEQWIHILGSD